MLTGSRKRSSALMGFHCVGPGPEASYREASSVIVVVCWSDVLTNNNAEYSGTLVLRVLRIHSVFLCHLRWLFNSKFSGSDPA